MEGIKDIISQSSSTKKMNDRDLYHLSSKTSTEIFSKRNFLSALSQIKLT